jgi:hypothetical protein
MVTATVSATANKDLPSSTEINDFVKSVNVPAGSDFIKTVSDAIMQDHKDWKFDIWDNGEMLSIYSNEGNCKRDYGSIYWNAIGGIISSPCGTHTPTTSYKGI